MFAALVACALLAAAAHAGPWGVPLGRRAVRAEISSAGDVDEYLVEAPAGARLDVTLRPLRGSRLVAELTLTGPDGEIVEAPVRGRRRARLIRRLPLADDGRYEIDVRSADGSSGAYSISASVRGALGGRPTRTAFTTSEQRPVAFAGGSGSRVSFVVASRSNLPSFVGIESPLGTRVTVPEGAVRRRGRRLVGRGIVLPAGQPFGSWTLLLAGAGAPAANVRVGIRVRGGRLAPTRGVLPAAEPSLIGVDPVEAGAGTVVEIDALGLRTAGPRPFRVFFAGVESADVARVTETRVTAVFPAGLVGPADVGIANGDGHADVLRDAILAVPPPRPTSIAPTRGPAEGGTPVEITGTDFRRGATVRIQGVHYAAEYVDPTLLRFETPPHPAGLQTFTVADPTGQERPAPGAFEFVAAPTASRVRPALVPHVADQSVRVDGSGLSAAQTVRIGGLAPVSVTYTGTGRMDLVLPDLPVGRHDLVITDDLGQAARLEDAVSVFEFVEGASIDSTGGPPAAAMALVDYDDDGDLDLFATATGGAQLSAQSLLRVLRNDGAAGFTDVTDEALPTPDGDDWRGGVIAFADIAAEVGATPPDGWPDLVVGSTDETVLGETRSRLRILANRQAPGGGRYFVDRTDVLMAPVDAFDDWWTEDVWIGDLDGDGGVDVVATFDGQPTGVSPVPGVDRVYYLSGSRVFTFTPGAGGGYGRFELDAARFPSIVGSRNEEAGVPTCSDGSCADDYTPFRGSSLAVADIDMDGYQDVAVSTASELRLQGTAISSAQVARSAPVAGQPGRRIMVDNTTSSLPSSADPPLRGGIVLVGDVSGDILPDVVVVARSADAGKRAVHIVENRGFGNGWALRTDVLLPEPDGAERFQADDALLRDVDGDGDLDLVLLAAAAPGSGARGLRILRNRGEQGFDRVLETLLPAPEGEDHTGTVLVAGDLMQDGGETILLARGDAAGTGTEIRAVRRTVGE